MKLHLTDEQNLLRETVAKLFRAESTSSRVRAAEASGFDPNLWSHLVEAGIHLMRAPEGADGLGLGLFDAVLVAEEAGRRLASVPLAEVLAAGSLLARLHTPEATASLTKLRDGSLIVLMPPELRQDERQVVPAAAVAAAVLALDGHEVVLIENLSAEAVVANLGANSLGWHVLKGSSAAGRRRVIASGHGARNAFLAAVEEWKLLTAAALVGLSL